MDRNFFSVSNIMTLVCHLMILIHFIDQFNAGIDNMYKMYIICRSLLTMHVHDLHSVRL
jgi:hypothetical protein